MNYMESTIQLFKELLQEKKFKTFYEKLEKSSGQKMNSYQTFLVYLFLFFKN
jgi:hypothetical protein